MTSFWDVEYAFDICVRMNRVAAARRRAVERSTKWLTELPRVVLCGVLAVLWCADKFPCLSGDFSLLSVALRNSLHYLRAVELQRHSAFYTAGAGHTTLSPTPLRGIGYPQAPKSPALSLGLPSSPP